MLLRLCHSAVTSVGPKYTHRPSSSVMTVLPHRMVVTAAIAYSKEENDVGRDHADERCVDYLTEAHRTCTDNAQRMQHEYGTSAHSAPVA